MDEGAPTTVRLRDVLDRAGRVVIAEASPAEADSAEVARIVVSGAAIADLTDLLAIVDGGTGDRCRCNGWPTIMVYDTVGRLIACWTLHHQSGLRGIGDCDADLRDGPALTEWLAERGLTRSQAVQEQLAAQKAEGDQRRLRWLRAAPAGLRDAATDVCDPPGPELEAWSGRLRVAEARLAALVQHDYPDHIERIRVLMAWAGVPTREPTGGLKWYDIAVQQQLLDEDPDAILTALTTRPPSPAQLDGAAELFASLEWTAAHGKQLPQSLRSMLIGHIQAEGTGPMRFRMSHGYYAAEGSA
ncbi:hypothetical protein ACIGDI_27110 [Streptomyces sp. NPDC085900]|uniref:hypothetical protein n=1 Tax=Streptomyces sp. NPDC085900 TaxID=3365737 RepID=UPI0037D772FB